MGSKKTKTTSNETAVTTPNLSPQISGAVNNYYGQLGGLLDNPTGAITPANQLQLGAWGGAQALNQNTSGLMDVPRQTLASAQNLVMGIDPAKVAQAALPAQYAPAKVGAVDYGPIAQAGVAATPTAAAVDTGFLSGVQAAGVKGASLLDGLDKYENRFMGDVVDATKADLLHDQAAQRAAYERQGALNNAFGGSNFAIGESALMGDQNRALGSTLGNLRAQAVRDAMTFSGQDADRRNAASIASMQSANSLLGQTTGYQMEAALANSRAQNDFGMAGFDAANTANLANAGYANDAIGAIYGANTGNARQDAGAANDALSTFYNAGVGNSQFNAGQANQMALANTGLQLDQANALAGIGNQQAGLAGQQYDMMTGNLGLMSDLGNQQYQYQQQSSPYSYLNAIGGLLDPSLIGQTTGQTINTNGTSVSKQSGGLLQSLLGAGAQLGSAALMASERRVKRDIVKLGEEADGLGVFRYNYIWDEPHEMPRFGVMVDEVETIRPWALGPVVDGIQTVNYGAL